MGRTGTLDAAKARPVRIELLVIELMNRLLDPAPAAPTLHWTTFLRALVRPAAWTEFSFSSADQTGRSTTAMNGSHPACLR
jgi:hypothetical protein